MKSLFALRSFAPKGFFGLRALGLPVAFLGLASIGLVAVTPATAQYSMRTGSLGGSLASRAFSRPLGGTTAGFTNFGAGRYSRGATRAPLYAGYPYAYSVWVPDYFDYLNSQNQYPAPYAYLAPHMTLRLLWRRVRSSP